MNTSYSSFERAVARSLSHVPIVKKMAKAAYARLIFLKFRQGESLQTDYEIFAIGGGGDRFFGYYDKSPWNKDGSQLLYHSVLDSGGVSIDVLDLPSKQARQLAVTTAWNWQQGAMLQWLPGKSAIAFNLVAERQLACKVIDLENGREVLCPLPIQAVHPDGCHALSLNYRRLFDQDSEYGYRTPVNNFLSEQAMEEDGIWHFGIFDGEPRLILSLSQLAQHLPKKEMRGAIHHVNHIMYSPSGNRFVFLHRWLAHRKKFSRLFVAQNSDASQISLLMDDEMVSHYCWFDDDSLLVYGRTVENGDRYYRVDVNSGRRESVGSGILGGFGDGHPSCSPDGRWVTVDTYPDRARMRHLLIYDTQCDRLHRIASFFAPWNFDGPNRVDLHPRWSPCGKMICVDSAHENRRDVYIVNVEKVVCS